MTIAEKIKWIKGLVNKKRSHDGKICYSKKSAEKAKISMERKSYPKKFDVYKCLWGNHYHIGKSVKSR